MIVEKREESFKGSESEVNTFSFDGTKIRCLKDLVEIKS